MSEAHIHQGGHEYAARLTWDGDPTGATFEYATYSRRHTVMIAGKPDLTCTAAPQFKGDPKIHDPEDLFVVAVASCHMLSYLALCARKGIRVLSYEDDARGTLTLTPGDGGKFTEVVLHPRVAIAGEDKREEAMRLHERAHEVCFIANSCSVPIRHEATIETR